MDLNAKAKAVAQIDAICDQFEKAYQEDSALLDADTLQLGSWLGQVPTDIRDVLRDELTALRRDLRHDALPKRERGARPSGIPQAVAPEIWNAVSQGHTFLPLSYEAKTALAKGIQHALLPAGAALMRAEERSPGLYLIIEGQVDVITGQGDQRQRIDEDGVGSILGEMSMLTGHPCSADVIATTNVKALHLPLETFESLRQAHPEIEIALSQLVSDRLGQRSRDALCGKTLGKYRLERCVGLGAMGVVYESVDTTDGTRRALKMLRHRFIYSPKVVSRFEQEAELLARLQHPHIISLKGHFVAYRTRFIVLDLYDGSDLREVLRRSGPLSESIARGILGQIASGLLYAHRHGVLHLDLKPANVLINRQGHVAITDFGLGRLIESDGCDTEVVGTPLYMPPEQFTMNDVGPHCDWYSFGCIAYELITGQRLFHATSAAGLLDCKSQTPSTEWPSIRASDEFKLLLKSSLQPSPAHRDLNLEEVAAWARPVPEIAAVLDSTE